MIRSELPPPSADSMPKCKAQGTDNSNKNDGVGHYIPLQVMGGGGNLKAIVSVSCMTKA